MIELDGENLEYGMSIADVEKLVTTVIGPSEMSYPLEDQSSDTIYSDSSS